MNKKTKHYPLYQSYLDSITHNDPNTIIEKIARYLSFKTIKKHSELIKSIASNPRKEGLKKPIAKLNDILLYCQKEYNISTVSFCTLLYEHYHFKDNRIKDVYEEIKE